MENGEKLQNHINAEVKEDINKLYDHAKTANEEMSIIKQDIAAMKADWKWMKAKMEKVDTRTWWILGTVVLGIMTQIALSLVN